MILYAVKISITCIPFSFKTFLFLYIIFLKLSLMYYITIMDRGLAFIDFFVFLCDLSMSSGLIFLFICSSITFKNNSMVSSPSTSSTSWMWRQLHLEYCYCLSINTEHPFPQVLFLSVFVFFCRDYFFFSQIQQIFH